eukprot:CAMPEP_0119298212 /NCGR_PEP_ID=MMETSP1333-20130426/412_1 /TAXON_ID=418940 /ORGANISM="Scyphosphaera apsteinii, Strain RCC1455" /LENGTH=71 /DNA_ID=CAMNT_0007299251 /DNA_START=67 /DNA_END=279 /DNA_ORIENTATION=+
MGKGKGQVKVFDMAENMSKKEQRKMSKMQYMIPYHMARCPNYGWKESDHYLRAEELKDDIKTLEKKAYARW